MSLRNYHYLLRSKPEERISRNRHLITHQIATLQSQSLRCTKIKGESRLWVLQHCCLEVYGTLTRMSSLIHLQRRCTHQVA